MAFCASVHLRSGEYSLLSPRVVVPTGALFALLTIGLHGHDNENPNDPFWLVPPSPLDAPVVVGGLSKDRREDLQILGFANVVAITGGGRHPIAVAPGEDPPDRRVTASGRSHAVELTELTMFDVRQDLADARSFGRALEEVLDREQSRFPHLVGRRVIVAAEPGRSLPRDPQPLLADLLALLTDDKGCVGDGVDLGAGLPQVWPNQQGFYGQHGSVNLSVYADSRPDVITVASACQADVRLSATVRTLEERVRAKDSPVNEVLLITCGLPDNRGYVCTTDSFMFQLLAENVEQLKLSPTHLSGVFLHLWGTLEWCELYRAEGADILWPT